MSRRFAGGLIFLLAGASAASASTLHFDTCNGFANQRLSIVHAASLAAEVGYSLSLPSLLSEGRQDLTRSVDPIIPTEDSGKVSFSHVYDERIFIRTLASAGLHVVASHAGRELSGAKSIDMHLDAARTEMNTC